MDLTGQLWKPPAPVRALTVTAIHLVRSEDAYEQVDLFTAGAAPKKEKQEKLEAAMDRLRGSSGPTSSPTARPVQRKRRIPCHDNRRGKTAAPGYDPAPQRPAPLPVPGSGGPGHRPAISWLFQSIAVPERCSASSPPGGRSTPVPSWSRLWQTARCCASLCVWRMASWSCGPSAT